MFDYVTTTDHVGRADYNRAAMKPPCRRAITLNCISNTGNCVERHLTVCKHDWIPPVTTTRQNSTHGKGPHALCASHPHNVDLTGLDVKIC